ncbi:MAG: hypothetical protein NT154_16115 [Verrucomicrobia bacterium]|nr:hypothetical protein [Verrucomicrobiota bacterium]
MKNPYAIEFARMGGRAGRGACKARSSAQARAAVMVRWSKYRKAQKAAKSNKP